MHGTLSPESLSAAFRELQARAASGILYVHVDGGVATKRVVFQGGRIVAAESDEPNTASSVESRTVLEELFRLHRGEYRFEATSPDESFDGTLDLSPEDVAVGAMRRAEEQLNGELRWCQDAERGLPYASSTLSTQHSALVDLLKERFHPGLKMSDVLAMSTLPREEALEALDSLIAAGILAVDRRPISEPTMNDAVSFPRFHTDVPPQKLGRFEVKRMLGRGSMGAVLLAQDPAIDRVVAIKLIQTAIHLPGAKQAKYKERFYREASAAGQLTHPNIVTVFDVGHDEDDTPFIVMEYVDGKTLSDILETERVTLMRALHIALDVLDGLAFAHSQGIVHRDIKPGNIMVTADGRAKITDFGIAHVVGSELTTDDDVLGSPYYMAPEQLSKGTIDRRTDLFSFAVVFYRMLTGALPFTGDSFAAIAQSILNDEPAPADIINPAVSVPLSAVILRCLEKDASDRYDTAEEVSTALKSAVGAGDANDLEGRLRRSGIVHRDRWLAIAIALIFGALFVFGLATTRDDEPDVPVGVAGVSEPSQPVDDPETDEIGPVELGGTSDRAETTDERPPVPAPAVTPPTPAPKPPSNPAPYVSTPTSPEHPEPPPTSSSEAPTMADLFYSAQMALERGELEESQAWLEELLLKDPTFAGASDLLTEVTDRIWEETLPLSYAAQHDHRLGSCNGELSLTTLGVRFVSEHHDWAWNHEDIRVLENPDDGTVFVETFEKDIFGLGKNKRYKFELAEEISPSDWERYQRLTR